MFNQVAPIWSVSETQAFATPRTQVIGASITDKRGPSYANAIETANQQAMQNLNTVAVFQPPAAKVAPKALVVAESATAFAFIKDQCEMSVSEDISLKQSAQIASSKVASNEVAPTEIAKQNVEPSKVGTQQEAPLKPVHLNHELAMAKEPAKPNDEQDFYLDFNALNSLKYEKDSDKALMQVAEKFEALFVQEMFKRMRSATEALGNKDNPLSNNSNSMFQTMLDTQLATSMTKQTSFGLAEMLYQQLSNNHLSKNSQGAV